MKPDTEQVKKILLSGKAADLHDLMAFSSKYNIEGGDNNPKDRDESMIYNLALGYVRFVSEYGLEVQEARDGDKFYVAHPENFEKWLSIGCVALTQEEIDAYLSDNPL